MRRILPLLVLGAAALRAQNAPQVDTDITSSGPAEVVSTDTETTTVIRDNVVVVATNLRLTCDLLTIVTLRRGDPSATLDNQQNIKSMVASGHVRIVQGDRIAVCGRAELLPLENEILLTVNPVLYVTGEKTAVNCEKMTLFRGQRKARFEGEVHIVAPPLRDLGADKAAAAPAP